MYSFITVINYFLKRFDSIYIGARLSKLTEDAYIDTREVASWDTVTRSRVKA